MDEAMRHLGDVLSFLSDLHPDCSCEALETALEFYNKHNPDSQISHSDTIGYWLLIPTPLIDDGTWPDQHYKALASNAALTRCG